MSLFVRREEAGFSGFETDRLAVFALICEVGLGLGLAIGLQGVVQGLQMLSVYSAALLALVLTRLLGNLEIRRGWKAAIILSAGGGFTFLNAVDLWSEVTGLSLKLAAYRFVRIAPDLMGDPQVMTELADQAWVKVQDFIAILEVWITQLGAGAPISIDQITEFVWGLAGFGMIAWAGWYLHIRLRPYLAVAPAILLMMVSVGVTDNGHGMFGLLLAVSLLIVVLFSHLDRERRWARAGHGYSTEIRLDLILFTLAIGFSFFMIAVAMPSVSAKKIIDRLREDRAAARETTDLGSGLGLYDQLPDDAAPASGGLPSSHLLTGEPELLDTLMFQVWVEDDPRGNAHGYWRTHVYQEYTGRGWLGGNVLPQRFGAGQRIEPSAGKDRVFLTIRAEGIYPRKRMVYANQIVWASQPVTAYLRESPEGTVDLSSVTISAQVYQVESARPSASVVDLQASGDVYPPWVADRYLQLPEGVPQRVIDLAAEITSNLTDPYTQAVAIEKYLRQFPYTLDIPGPPADQDVADHFLFELQQGYCDYYATTMVVLARSIGLPARVVSGYRGGELDETTGAIQVTGDNAHSWVEVYFNGIGWIEFEPTPAYPLIALDQSADDRTGPEGIVDGLDPASALLAARPVLVWGTGLTFLAMAAVFGWDRIKFRRASARGLLIMARERVQQIAFDLGVEQPGSATLNELRASLSAMIAARFPEWFSRRSEVILGNLIAPLAEAAYRGKPPETFQRRGITASLLHARRVSILIRLSNFFER